MPSKKSKAAPAKPPSQRQLRVAELIRHALSDVLTRGDISDESFVGRVVTVPEVRMSPDLKLATIYIMPLGGEGIEEVLAGLDRHKKFLRGELAHRVNLRYAPDIRFRADDTFDEAMRIDALLRNSNVQRDLLNSLSPLADKPSSDDI